MFLSILRFWHSLSIVAALSLNMIYFSLFFTDILVLLLCRNLNSQDKITNHNTHFIPSWAPTEMNIIIKPFEIAAAWLAPMKSKPTFLETERRENKLKYRAFSPWIRKHVLKSFILVDSLFRLNKGIPHCIQWYPENLLDKKFNK